MAAHRKVPQKKEFLSEGLAWTAVVVAALALFAHDPYHANPDAISYLDMALNAVRGSGGELINAYWSPLFPAALTLAYEMFRPNADTLYPLAHLLQAALVVVGYGVFRQFCRELGRKEGTAGDPVADTGAHLFLDSRLFLTALYLWAIRKADMTSLLTPDLLGFVMLWLTFTFGMRWLRSPTHGHGAIFGLTAGLAGLSKAFYVPLGLLSLALAFVFARKRPRIAVPALVFLLVMATWWVPLREKSPAFPFGAAGTLNQAWVTQKMGILFIHWQPEQLPNSEQFGQPAHTTRVLSTNPAAYEFGTPIRATYSPWYAPAYWFEGLKAHPTPAQRWSRFAEVLRGAWKKPIYRELLGILAGMGLVIFALLRSTARWPRRSFLPLRDLRVQAWTALSAGGGLLAYMTINNLPRYWFGLILALVLAGVALLDLSRPNQADSRRFLFLRGLLWGAMVLLCLRRFPAVDLGKFFQDNFPRPPATVVAAKWVRADSAFGLSEGDGIGFVGSSIGEGARFAQPAGLRIVTEVPRREGASKAFCRAAPEARASVLEKMLDNGAKHVFISKNVSCRAQAAKETADHPKLAGRVHDLGELQKRALVDAQAP